MRNKEQLIKLAKNCGYTPVGLLSVGIMSQKEYVDGREWNRLFLKFDPKKSESMANHLWNKFVGHNHHVGAMWSFLDLNNKPIVVEMINDWKQEE